MARIAGVDLPREKRVEIALTYIFGIGRPTSGRILGETGVSPDTRVRDLSDAEVARLRQYLERTVKVGDVIFIPAGIYHGMKETRSTTWLNIRFPEHRN